MRSAEDRHTVWLTLTEAGHEKLREVWPDHRDSIYLYFGQYLEVAAHNGTYVRLITHWSSPLWPDTVVMRPGFRWYDGSDPPIRLVIGIRVSSGAAGGCTRLRSSDGSPGGLQPVF